ncbi:MAG TPA: ATP-binding protein [Noviherbaspirillum sp.]
MIAKALADRPADASPVLLFFIVLTIAAIIGQTWWVILQDRELTLASEKANGLVAVRILEEHATQTLQDAERRIDAVAAAIQASSVFTEETAIREVRAQGMQDYRYLKALQYVNTHGQSWITSRDYPSHRADVSDRDYVSFLLSHPAHAQSVIGRPFQSRYDSQLVVPIGRNLYDRNGRHVGLISIDIRLSYFASVYARVAKDSNATVSLFADAGFIIVRSPFEARYAGRDIAMYPVLHQLRHGPAEGSFEDDSLLDDELPRLYTYRKISGFPITTAYGRDFDSILADWRSRTQNRILFSGAMIAFVCVLTWFLVMYIKRLRATENEIRALNAELEERVHARTRSLEKSNAELAQALASLQNMQNELIRSEKMAALGSLVAGVAHELNTPIGNSVTVASTLMEQTEAMLIDEREGRLRRSIFDRYLENAATGTELLLRTLQRASELVSSFKQVAVDQSSDQRRRFDLQHVLQEVAVTLAPTYKKTPYKLVLDLAPDIELDSFPGPLGQVITNFITNSLTHGFEERDTGTMRLATRKLDGEQAEIVFSDDGIGIPDENQKRVFDPFFTTKLGQGGSGLGMNIVYNLVTNVLGGKITLRSAPGKGTTLVVVLPLHAPEAAGVAADALH